MKYGSTTLMLHKKLCYTAKVSGPAVLKVQGGSFSENGGGPNIWGTERVLFVGFFFKDDRISLGYCTNLLTNFRDAAR